MCFYDKVLYLLIKNHKTQNEMIREIKLGKNVMFQWKNRNNIPNGETLLKLSHYFKVPVDFLLDNMDYCFDTDFIIRELDDETLCRVIELLNKEAEKRSVLSFPTGE